MEARLADGQNKICFINLYPSQHPGVEVRPFSTFAKANKFNELAIVNLFGLVVQSPAVIPQAWDPVGPLNDAYILAAAKSADCIVCNWGDKDVYMGRGSIVKDLLKMSNLKCHGIDAKVDNHSPGKDFPPGARLIPIGPNHVS